MTKQTFRVDLDFHTPEDLQSRIFVNYTYSKCYAFFPHYQAYGKHRSEWLVNKILAPNRRDWIDYEVLSVWLVHKYVEF